MYRSEEPVKQNRFEVQRKHGRRSCHKAAMNGRIPESVRMQVREP
jgi:hypothetical protein